MKKRTRSLSKRNLEYKDKLSALIALYDNDAISSLESLSQTGLDNLRESASAVGQQFVEPMHLQLSNGTSGMIPNRQQRLSAEYLQAVAQLHKIFVTRRIESANYGGDLPTSFVRVEKEIARCISECLADVPVQMRNTSYTQFLVRCYKVVQLLPDGSHSVSLHKVHLILQDNYRDSCFCKLLNILLAGFMGSETKTIEF